ncbi:MAG: hypothetical protein ACREGC_01190 [Minisyncoccia bacterium]
MQPEAPPAPPPVPMPNGGHDPYEFIMSTPHKPKRGFGGSFGNMKQRVFIAAIGFGGLLIVAVIFISILGGGGATNVTELTKLAQEQTEISRVAGLGINKAGSSTAKNLAMTTQLSMQSAQADTVAYLQKVHHKLSGKQLSLLQDSNTDKQLDAASASGTYDSTLTQVLQTELKNYQTALQSAYKNTSSATERQLLQNNFNSVSYLLGTQKTS